MSRTHTWRRVALGGAAGLLGLAGAAAVVVPAASQEAPVELAVADAFASGSPIASVLRIPNEIPGGALFTLTATSLDKSQAAAAGYTPGPLAEAFLKTTIVAPPEVPAEVGALVPPYENPTLAEAQTPPSEVFPETDEIGAGGFRQQGAKGGSIRATTSETSATADAIGAFTFEAEGVSIGNAGSTSSSEVLGDGTVVATTRAFLSDLSFSTGLLRIGEITSTARVALKPGSEPVQELEIAFGAVEVAGIPVLIDPQGVRVAETGLLGAAELATVNTALASLAEQGFSIELFPGVEREATDQSVRVAGAAMSIRGNLVDYVPTSIDTPAGPIGSPLGDVGTDNELLFGRVEASVFAAERQPFPGAGLGPAPALPGPSSPAIGAPVTGPTPAFDTSTGAGGLPLPQTAEPTTDTGTITEIAGPVTAGPLELVRRTAPPGVAALRTGYRAVMGLALLGALIPLVWRRTRIA